MTASASGHLLQKPLVEEKARETNVSSSTFDSAIPRNTHLPASSQGSSSKEPSSSSPTKAIFGFASESSKEHKQTTHARDRSVSPNGRPRYTSVLGQPLGQTQQGHLSPVSATEPEELSGGMKKELSVEDRLKALMDGKTEGASRSNSYTFTAASAKTSLCTRRVWRNRKQPTRAGAATLPPPSPLSTPPTPSRRSNRRMRPPNATRWR